MTLTSTFVKLFNILFNGKQLDFHTYFFIQSFVVASATVTRPLEDSSIHSWEDENKREKLCLNTSKIILTFWISQKDLWDPVGSLDHIFRNSDLHGFDPFQLIDTCFIMQCVVSHGECSVYIWKQCVLLQLLGLAFYKCQFSQIGLWSCWNVLFFFLSLLTFFSISLRGFYFVY